MARAVATTQPLASLQRSMPLTGSSDNLPSGVTLSFLEGQIVASSALQSATEFRHWILTTVNHLLEKGKIQKIRNWVSHLSFFRSRMSVAIDFGWTNGTCSCSISQTKEWNVICMYVIMSFNVELNVLSILGYSTSHTTEWNFSNNKVKTAMAKVVSGIFRTAFSLV